MCVRAQWNHKDIYTLKETKEKNKRNGISRNILHGTTDFEGRRMGPRGKEPGSLVNLGKVKKRIVF